jgi:hypothetical protein
MNCNNTINNQALVRTLTYVKQKIHGIGAAKGTGHFPKEEFVCVTQDIIQYRYTCYHMPQCSLT